MSLDDKRNELVKRVKVQEEANRSLARDVDTVLKELSTVKVGSKKYDELRATWQNLSLDLELGEDLLWCLKAQLREAERAIRQEVVDADQGEYDQAAKANFDAKVAWQKQADELRALMNSGATRIAYANRRDELLREQVNMRTEEARLKGELRVTAYNLRQAQAKLERAKAALPGV